MMNIKTKLIKFIVITLGMRILSIVYANVEQYSVIIHFFIPDITGAPSL